jgi:hypothetical protein
MFTACFALALPSTSKALDIWHSNTVWAGQGMCAFTFTVDGQDMQAEAPAGVSNLTLEIVPLNEGLKELGSPVTIRLTETFADSTATRYEQFFIEGDCDAETFGISKATGIIGGRERDLLESRQLTPRKFEPKDLILPAKYAES